MACIQKISLLFYPLFMVLEKDTEDQLDRSCEKFGSIKKIQDGEEYPTGNINKEG